MIAVPKKRYAIYYYDDAGLAKTRAAVLRQDGHQTILLDAHMFKDTEQVDFVEYMSDVPSAVKEQIQAVYEGDGTVRVSDPVNTPAETKIEVPANWKKMSWTQLQALASEIAPDETVRTKDDAKRIIADYLEDNEED